MTKPVFELALELEHGETSFEPGGRLAGVAAWSVSAPLKGIELRLKWTSRGAGGRDIKIADTIVLPEPLATERRPFILTVPMAPFSFQGALVGVGWELELVALPVEEKASVAITIAPGRRALVLEDMQRQTQAETRPE
jgi:hypothetical protein